MDASSIYLFIKWLFLSILVFLFFYIFGWAGLILIIGILMVLSGMYMMVDS